MPQHYADLYNKNASATITTEDGSPLNMYTHAHARTYERTYKRTDLRTSLQYLLKASTYY